MANAMISFRKTLVISGLLGLMSHAVVLAQTSTPQIVDKTTACINAPLKENCIGVGTTIYPWFDEHPSPEPYTKMEVVPEPIKELIETLPIEQIIVPVGLRTEYLLKNAWVAAISGLGTLQDYLVYQNETSGLSDGGISFWFRSFESKDAADTIFLISFNTHCALIEDYFSRHPESNEPHISGCSKYSPGPINDEDIANASLDDEFNWQRVRRSETASMNQLRAYRRNSEGHLKEVTSEVLPPLSSLALPRKELQKYWSLGFEGVTIDDRYLGIVPVFRWVGRFFPRDGGTTSLRNDPRFLSSGEIFFTYVVWNGKTFELRRWVTRDLWPCQQDTNNTEYCEDEFVYNPEAEVITQAKDGYVNLRSKPSTQAKILKKLNNDLRLQRLKDESPWIQVKIEGIEGYVHQSQVLHE